MFVSGLNFMSMSPLKTTLKLALSLMGITVIALISACSNKHVLNERIALTEVRYHLENNPVYETVIIDYGEVKFKKSQDSLLLDAYEHLVNYGYATMDLLDERRRFLSRDSTFTYNIRLTDKAIPYVLEQSADKITVKTYDFILVESDPIHLEQSGKNRAKVTVTLKQQETDFAMFAEKNRKSNASFIKRTYNMRFDDASGWRIAR